VTEGCHISLLHCLEKVGVSVSGQRSAMVSASLAFTSGVHVLGIVSALFYARLAVLAIGATPQHPRRMT
jgi:hypothetical protein